MTLTSNQTLERPLVAQREKTGAVGLSSIPYHNLNQPG
jgi:hypothetical protein